MNLRGSKWVAAGAVAVVALVGTGVAVAAGDPLHLPSPTGLVDRVGRQ